MSYNKLFLDTSYVIASLITKDEYFDVATKLSNEVNNAKEVWIHEGILLEVGDWFSGRNRNLGFMWIKLAYAEKFNLKIVKLTTELIEKGLELYEKYSDKTIGLTDCISFIVMKEKGIFEALTSDKHFEQAGFKVLLSND